MPALGITGGVGAGKSSFTKLLQPLLAADVFDADVAAREILSNDPEVQSELRKHFPEQIRPGGEIDRSALREIVFRDANKRAILENILHPRIRRQWLSLLENSKANRWTILEIPLLYETGSEVHLPLVVVVACSPETQIQRLVRDRGLPLDGAERMIAAQMDLTQKVQRADYVIWNDGVETVLEAQADLLAKSLP